MCLLTGIPARTTPSGHRSAQAKGIDTLNAIGVGSGVDHNLLEQIVFPQPAGGERGFVLSIDNYGDYEAAIAGKVRREARLVDLTVGALTVTDGGPEQPATIDLVVGNAGTGPSPEAVVLRLRGIAADGVSLWEKDVALETVPANDYSEVSLSAVLPPEVVEVVAFVDPGQTVSECNRENNRIALPVATDQGAIDVATNAAEYGPATDMTGRADFTNIGSLRGRFQSLLQVEDKAGTVLETFDEFESVELQPGEKASVHVSWNTGSTLAGDYRLRGVLMSSDGQPADEAVAGFRIVHSTGSEPAARLRATTDRAVYHTSDRVLLENLARNLTGTMVIEAPVIALTITAPDGSVWRENTLSFSALQPRGERIVYDHMVLDRGPVGEYHVSAILHGENGLVLATDSTTFRVEEDLEKALSGVVEAEFPSQHQGEAQVCRATLSNSGIGALESVPVRQLVVAVEQGESVVAGTSQVSLEAGGEREWAYAFSTSPLPVGSAACVLQAQADGDWRTLDYASFEVTEPPIIIDSAMEVAGDKGRVLVLMDARARDCHDRPDSDSSRRSGTGDCARGIDKERSVLEALLDEAGWSYTVTVDAEAFTAEFRSGTYTAYALFSREPKLSEQVQKELREAVYRGEGLLVAGGHDQRNGRLEEPLGITVQGKHAEASGIALDESAVHGEAVADLAIREKVLIAASVDAEPIGWFTGVHRNRGRDVRLALARHAYGEGRSLFVAFDLLAQAAAKADPLFRELLRGALADIRPESPDLHTGAPVPVDLTLSNRGVATPGQALIIPPEKASLLEPGGAVVQRDGSLQWPFDLQEAEEENLVFWLQLPSEPGPAHLETLIQTGIARELEDYDSLLFTLQVEELPMLQSLVGEAGAISNRVSRILEKAYLASLHGEPAKALREALKAADSVAELDSEAAHALRRRLSLVIRELARATEYQSQKDNG